MKKSLLALAVIGASAGTAQAQSNVTIYGSIDAGLRNQTNTNANGNGTLTMNSGTYYANRLGFMGSEDLGGGLRANFTLESGFSTKNGALDNRDNVLFNRVASVGLGGAWGSVDFGRQYTIAFKIDTLLDPFNHRYTGIVPTSLGNGTTLPKAATDAGLSPSASSGGRFNNDIQYTGTFGPVTARAEYALGEVAGSTGRGAAQAAGLSYASGPVLAAAAYTQKQNANGFDNKAYLVGGGYAFGNLKAKLGYSNERQETAAAGDFTNKIVWTGASYAISPALELTGAYYHSKFSSNAGGGKRKLFIVGATYALSKRTRLYADVDVNRYDGALIPATTGQSTQNGISAGISHLF
jgi:predicted porin